MFLKITKMNLTKLQNDFLVLEEQLGSRGNGRAILETLLYFSVILVGIVGNGAVLWIVYKKRNSGKMSYFLIGSLAVSDILLPFFTGWQSLAVLKLGRWPFSDIVCQFQGFSVISFACASLLIMTLTAVNRYFRVVRPHYYPLLFTPKRMKIFIFVLWSVACAEPIPYLATGQRYIFHPVKYFCFQEVKFTAPVILLYFFSAGIPMFVMSICYYQIFKVIRIHQQRIANMRNESAKSLTGPNIEDIRATRTLFLTVVGFLCCWAPIFVIDFIDLARGSSDLPREVYVMYTFLGNTSASINPFIYGAMNSMFREEYKRIFKLNFICRKSNVNSDSPVITQTEIVPPKRNDSIALHKLETEDRMQVA